jgi:hypothetical protein
VEQTVEGVLDGGSDQPEKIGPGFLSVLLDLRQPLASAGLRLVLFRIRKRYTGYFRPGGSPILISPPKDEGRKR